MIELSIRMKNYVSLSNPLLSALRNAATRGARKIPGLRDYFTKARFKPRPRYLAGQYFGLPRRRRSGPEGEQIPQPTVAWRDGRQQLLDDVLGEGFSLVGFGVDPRAALAPAELAALARLDARCVTLFPLGGRPQGMQSARSAPAGLPELEDCSGELTAWLGKSGVGQGAVAILRPDRFTYALVPAAELPAAPQPRPSHLQPRAAARRGRRWTHVQRQHIGDGTASVLFGKCVESFRQDAVVEGSLERGEPCGMECVEDSGLDLRPVMYGHVSILHCSGKHS